MASLFSTFLGTVGPASTTKNPKDAGFAITPAYKMCYPEPPLPQQDIF